MKKNSRYYSAKPPALLNRDAGTRLPHVTIQMPVYKEGLSAVIKPTVQSVKRAISTYELQGGTASIFVNDDGSTCSSNEHGYSTVLANYIQCSSAQRKRLKRGKSSTTRMVLAGLLDQSTILVRSLEKRPSTVAAGSRKPPT